MQEYLAVAEERLRSVKLEAALAEHQAEVEAVVSQMREGGASEHAIAVYEAEQAVEEAKMGAAEVTSVGLPAAQTMGVSDLFLRKDLGTHVGHYTGRVDIDGGLMLRLSGPKQTASASPLAITEGVHESTRQARQARFPSPRRQLFRRGSPQTSQPEPEPETARQPTKAKRKSSPKARFAREQRSGMVQRGEGRKAGRARLVFKLPPTATETPADIGKKLFVVDRSSSMRDSYGQVKSAVRYILDQSKEEPGFVLYDSRATFATAEEVLNSSVKGQTSFEAAFGKIQEYVETQSAAGSTVRVVFMTDGEDTASHNLTAAKRSFRDYLQSCGREVSVNTLGFSQGHKQAFLEELRKMGTSEGIYRYVESAEQSALEKAFGEMEDLVGTQHTVRVEGMEGSIQAIPTPLDDGWLSFDEIATGLPDSVLQKGGGITVVANNERVVLEDAPVDALFTIRTTGEEEIESPSDLETLQEELSEAGPQIARLPAAQRQAAEAAQELVQAKLDTAKQLFDDRSRGTLTGQAFTARLKSL